MSEAQAKQPGGTSALARRLQGMRSQLSGGRRQLVDGILQNLDETVFLSSHQLAERFDTDPATVVRTVQALGYDGFADFARDLRGHFLSNVSPYRVMAEEATDRKGPAHHVRLSLQREVQNLQRVQETLDPAQLVALGERLRRCRTVVVSGGDLDHTLAAFLAYTLSAIGIAATAPAGEGLTLARGRGLTREDGVIAVGFRRCLRVPVEITDAARARGAFTLAITDAATTPLARRAEHVLLAPIEGESFASSYVAPLAVMNALLVACAHADARRTLELLKPTDAEYQQGLRWHVEPGAPRRKPRARRRTR
ncbi:MAG TPA: MurR/RpiR family transcriptional regulator [Candidatus Binatia bacterium]|nr:MurR/RpiR family transcriptional regulator [Candidatus Binatia bacterium]